MIRKIIKRIDWIAFIASGLSIVAFGVWCAKMPADIVIGVCFASGVWLAVINGMFKEYIYEYRKLNKALDKERMEEFKRFMVEYRESYDSAPEEELIPEEDDDEISVPADSALIQSDIPYGDIREFLQRNGLPLNVIICISVIRDVLIRRLMVRVYGKICLMRISLVGGKYAIMMKM